MVETIDTPAADAEAWEAGGTADAVSGDEAGAERGESAEQAGSAVQRRRASRPAGPPPEIDDTPAVITVPATPPAAAEAEENEETAKPERPVRRVRTTRATRPAMAPDEALEEAEPSKPARSRTRAAKEGEAPSRSRTRRRPAGPPPEVAEEHRAAVPTAPVTPPVPGVPVVPDLGPGGQRTQESEPVSGGVPSVTFQPPMVVFQPPQPVPPRAEEERERDEEDFEPDETAQVERDEDEEQGERPSRRRRRRGGRGRGRGGRDTDEEAGEEAEEPAKAEKDQGEKAGKGGRARGEGKEAKEARAESGRKKDEEAAAGAAEAETADEAEENGETGGSGSRRRRRRRRRAGAVDGDGATVPDDPPNTVVHVRDSRAVEDEVQSVRGSTRLEAKKQRRREGREQGRRRPPVITEAEFLARRESVEREMVVRQEGERTQIAVLEDGVLVEHYVNRATHQSYVGNVYLGKVQNVLPSMEAAFVDIGKGRNAVLYAGEVNWDVAGLEGQPRRIESALKSGQAVLVQVTKDPVGHKGARLTSQISLPGRYLVYVPDGSMTGISRKLPDKERSRLKQILKKVMPENAGVIVRTAAEGATEEELARDVSRLAAQWDNIQKQVKSASAPSLLYGEPDLTIRVVRDIFNEDFSKLVVAGDGAWDTVSEYVEYVAPHLADRVERWTDTQDVLSAYRIDEQIAKALDRKVWLPSGGSLVIDRTEAMTVIDVNTGKFTGQGGNLEETVTRNNLEAAEEIVRQLRLRDIGGIVVIDFIDMVLESNRDLVLRRLVECLSRDRTKHQVAEVTSLGLVQMTRKRVGQGLLEAFSETCESCNGRGIHVHMTPVEPKADKGAGAGASGGAGGRRRKRKGEVEKAVEEKLSQQERAKGKTKEAKEGKAAKEKDEAQAKREQAKPRVATRPAGAPPEELEAADPPGGPAGLATASTSPDAADVTEEPEPQAAVEAAEAAAESAESGPGALASEGPVDPLVNGAEPADEAEPGPGLEFSTEPEPEAEAEPGSAAGTEDDQAALSNGRRRRTRRVRAKAEAASADPGD
ncbi:Rne/Rng family ribonuclease [Actinomadura sp. NBRC 104412]|uniref:Rne/Rng family ribonuclease n=1 Tax=Actinomadura sp. NBRC 104412 TaxID=3032203 RepID=UPI002554042A|nr:Rne/Rng family ribonuclease [Actinomadura sp. NBRC 104412]